MATTTETLRVVVACAALAALGAADLAAPGALQKPRASGYSETVPPSKDSGLFGFFADPFAAAAAEVGLFCLAFAIIRFASPKGGRQAARVGGKGGAAAGAAARRPTAEPAPKPAPKTLPELQAQAAGARLADHELECWAATLLELHREQFMKEAVAYISRHDRGWADGSLALLMHAAAKAGLPDTVVALSDAVRESLGWGAEGRFLEQCLIGAHAAAGNGAEVDARMKGFAAAGEVSMKTYSMIVRGCFSSGHVSQAMRYLSLMHEAGHEVPPPALTELVSRSRRQFGSLREVTTWLGGEFFIPLPPEVIVHLVDQCFELPTVEEQVESALLTEQLAKAQDVALPAVAYGKWLRLYCRTNNSHGIECLRRMVKEGHRPCERLCSNVMSRCAESQNVVLAEALAMCLRANSEMTLVSYKTLMKVYAYAGMYDKACDLYHMVLAAGLEPDAVMYGSLLKFAAKAGRTSLSQELLRKSEGAGCIKTYLWTIRNCGQRGDVPRALSTFDKLRETQSRVVDGMAYNMIIDACCSNKRIDDALRLAEEMEASGVKKNHVTFNTLMKGYCQLGDLESAKRTMAEMEAAGFVADATSFSCVLSCAAKALNISEMWSVVAQMDARGLPPDSYVVSILMQASRKATKAHQAFKMLTILDRPDVKICEDEVVFNCVLDACIARRDRQHLDSALSAYNSPANRVKPSTRTYSLMIKACAVLGRTEDAMAVWNGMLKSEDVRPNDITVGCIIDALVEGRAIDEALTLFQEWKGRVKYDTIIYSTLIKGFASVGDPDRAVALYRDMKSEGVPVNHIVFTSLITAYARVGHMKPADGIFEEMLAEGVKPNSITYSVMIRGHCVKGDLPAALEVLKNMVGLGFPADCVIFNTLLDGCVRHSNWDLADTLLEEMAKQGVERSNFTVSIIIKMWSKRGNLDKAFETIYEALKAPQALTENSAKRYAGPNIDAQVGSCIVGACIHNRDPMRALQVFQDMKTWPSFDGPDANTYGAMICGMAKHGHVLEAVEIAEEACVTLRSAYDRKMINSSALMQLFRALRASGALQEHGPRLSAKLRGAGMVVEDHWLRA